MTAPITSHLDKPKLDNLEDQIWKSAERLRGKFKAHEYQNVILPIITIRRLECVLIKWREEMAEEIRRKRRNISDKELAKLIKNLELNSKQSPFSNRTMWTLRKVYEEDHTLLEKNFRAYLKGFSENVQVIIDKWTPVRIRPARPPISLRAPAVTRAVSLRQRGRRRRPGERAGEPDTDLRTALVPRGSPGFRGDTRFRGAAKSGSFQGVPWGSLGLRRGWSRLWAGIG